jgi:uncharacterized Tic20 family protein
MTQVDQDSRTWGMFCHLSVFLGYVFPFANFIAPLVIWLSKREGSPFVDDQGKEALNFQISLVLYGLLTFLLCFVVIGFLLIPFVVIAGIVLPIIAGVKANNGEWFRYPMTIRLIK